MPQQSIKINSNIFKIKSNAIITKNLEDNNTIYQALRYINSFNIKHVVNYSMLNNLKTNKDIHIEKNCDTINIDKLIIPNNYDINKIKSLQIKNGYAEIFDIPFSYLLFFSKIKKDTQNTVITIDTKTFMSNFYIEETREIEGINLIHSAFSNLYFKLTSDEKIVFSIRLKRLFYDSTLRRKITNNTIYNKIHDFDMKQINQFHNYKIFYSALIGIFVNVKCTLAEEPTALRIIFDNKLIFDYNKEELLQFKKANWSKENNIIINYSYYVTFERKIMNYFNTWINFYLQFDKVNISGDITFIYENTLKYLNGEVNKCMISDISRA